MDFLTSTDPIIACSSGALTNTAIAVVRISGLKSFETINELFSIDLLNIDPRYAYYCDLLHANKLIDQIVLTWFKSPNSFNGENILELGVHGNVLNIERIINIFNDKGIRTASPGEFTYRALRNKKLTLSQVEGLDLLINANSNFGLNQGFSLMNGKLQNDYLALNQAFINHKSAVELSIDFFEDIGEEQADLQFNSTLSDLVSVIEKLKGHIKNESFNLLSPEVALIGLPNAGKSSLFNILLKDKRAIVSSIAGTTRDYISERIKINNNFFNLVDTAGIRSSSDLIEAEGIQRSLEIAKSSFFKLLVVDPFDINTDYFEQISSISIDLIVFSHRDKSDFTARVGQAVKSLSLTFGPIEPIKSGPIGAKNNGPIEPTKSGPIGAKNNGPIEPTKSGPIGAKTTQIDSSGPLPFICADLSEDMRIDVEVIESLIASKFSSILKSEPVLIDRHKSVINSIYLMVRDYRQLAGEVGDISIISSELNTIGHCISELIGILSPDDVLHNIFDNFCIGK